MSLYYQDDYITLYHGDCLELDAWLAADVLVTDPPYGIDWRQNDYDGAGRRNAHRVHAGIANDNDTSTRDKALARWGQRPALMFGSFRAPPPPNVVQTLIWHKPPDAGVVGSTTGYRTDIEPIYLLGKHPHRSASRSAVIQARGAMAAYRSGHPHAKPVSVLEQLIEWTTGTVADPFAGAGTTLIASRNQQRKAIGIELDERYCELTARRLDQLCLPLT